MDLRLGCPVERRLVGSHRDPFLWLRRQPVQLRRPQWEDEAYLLSKTVVAATAPRPRAEGYLGAAAPRGIARVKPRDSTALSDILVYPLSLPTIGSSARISRVNR